MFASCEVESLSSSVALSVTSFEVDVSAFSEALTERLDLRIRFQLTYTFFLY